MNDILKDTTFGVCCTGNIQALLMCLSSVLQGTLLPRIITVRLEGHFPAFSNFYLEQLSALARHKGIEFNISVGDARGVRAARDWQLNNCRTSLLWMGDDDVIYSPQCLEMLDKAEEETEPYFREDGEFGYVVGSKPDITNRRGYGDFSTKVLPTDELKNFDSFNQFYQGPFRLVRVNTLDTGNVLLNVEAMRAKGLTFNPFKESFNSGGEDTLMGMRMNGAGLYGFFCPNAASVHLEKPMPAFNEFAARGELLLRSLNVLGLDTGPMDEFMPFLKRG